MPFETRVRQWHAILKNMPRRLRSVWITVKEIPVFGLNLAHLFEEKELQRSALAELAARLGDGRIRPTVDATFPLTAAGAARATVLERGQG